MKLTYFNDKNIPKGSNRIASVPRINMGKNGAIRLNAAASEMMKLKETDRISIAQDQDEPENWYVFKDDKNGFVLRMMWDKKSFGFNHTPFIRKFKEALKIDSDRGFSYRLAKVPTTVEGDKTEYWGILIK